MDKFLKSRFGAYICAFIMGEQIHLAYKEQDKDNKKEKTTNYKM